MTDIQPKIAAHVAASTKTYTDMRFQVMQAQIRTLQYELEMEHTRRISAKLRIHVVGIAAGGVIAAILTWAGVAAALVVIIALGPNLAIECFDAKFKI